MNSKLMLAGIGLCVCAACSTPETYRIKGTIEGTQAGDTLRVVALDAAGKDSVLIKTAPVAGAFEASLEAPVPDVVYLVAKKQRVPMFIEPAVKTYEVRFDSTGISTTGGALQAVWQSYYSQKAGFEARKDSVEEVYRMEAKADNLFGKMHQLAVYEELEQAQKNAEDSVLRQNDNAVAAAIVQMQVRRLLAQHALIDKMALLGANALLTTPGLALKAQQAAMDRMERENIAPDFTQNDPDGKPVSLYGIQAKVKILDFWASWCGPCRAETPNVRRIYEKYKGDGLEIISVSLDTKKDAWVNAMEKDQMNWLHTSDLKGWKNEVAKLYGVSSIPAIFVLDSENHIIGKNLRGQALEDAVKKALGK